MRQELHPAWASAAQRVLPENILSTTFDIEVQSSISKIFRKIQYRVKTFDIEDLLYRVRYIQHKNFDIEGQELRYLVSSI